MEPAHSRVRSRRSANLERPQWKIQRVQDAARWASRDRYRVRCSRSSSFPDALSGLQTHLLLRTEELACTDAVRQMRCKVEV